MPPAEASLEVDVVRHDDGWPEGLEARAEAAVREALRQSRIALEAPSEVSILLTDDAEQRELNRQWRDIDRPTNVLSFPGFAPGTPVFGMLGDISLARETVAREAEEQGKTLADHFSHLVVHGFLHILGYDHLVEDEALAMEGLETQILGSLGIADPYAGDTGEPGDDSDSAAGGRPRAR